MLPFSVPSLSSPSQCKERTRSQSAGSTQRYFKLAHRLLGICTGTFELPKNEVLTVQKSFQNGYDNTHTVNDSTELGEI
jgi:hypothetical protein